jgi:Virulence-associated protein and related proteins
MKQIAKIFKNGRSQAVRIPHKFRFNTMEVSVHQEGESLVLTPIKNKMTLDKFLAMPTFPDFEVERSSVQKVEKRNLFQ